MRVQICRATPLKGQEYMPTYFTKVTIVGRSFVKDLNNIVEGIEPEDTQMDASPSGLVPTPYFTPWFYSPHPEIDHSLWSPWTVDPNSPPENPTDGQLCYMMSKRIPLRQYVVVQPSAPQLSSVQAFPAFLGYDLTAGQAYSNLLNLGMYAEGKRAYNSRVGLGLDVSGLKAKELSCPQVERL